MRSALALVMARVVAGQVLTCRTTSNCGELFCAYNAIATPSCNIVFTDYTGGANFLCLTTQTQGVCQRCPPGYHASGAYCMPCPYGLSCDTSGRVACRGQCSVRSYPVCDESTGYVNCLPCDVNTTALAAQNRLLVTGGVLGTPALCDAYFECAVGYYLTGGSNQTQYSCQPCLIAEGTPAAWRFWSHGLTFGDAFSCLYEPATSPVATNALGYYGTQRVSCPPGGYTSRPGLALTAADCLKCPNAPANGQFVEGMFDCSVECGAEYAQAGEACVPRDPGAIPCADSGYSMADGGCTASPLPWNTPGWQRLDGVGVTVEAVPGAPLTAYDISADARSTAQRLYSPGLTDLCASLIALAPNAGYVEDKPLFAATCAELEGHEFYLVLPGGNFLYAFLERSFGFNNRYIMWQVDARRDSGRVGKVWQTFRLPGKVCSAAWAPLDGVDYVYMALCDASYLVYTAAYDLTSVTGAPKDVTSVQRNTALYAIGRRYGRLIGQEANGLADGLRDVARFGSTLSVASSSDPRRLFVADADHCRLVEVVIDAPGSFLTRATTVGTPSCFHGPTPQPSPRLLTSIQGGRWLLWVTDTGVMQMDVGTRTLQLALSAEDMPLTPRWIGVQDGGTRLLLANSTHLATVTRLQGPCPEHQTSAPGADCIECPRTSYAQPGGCQACSSPTCQADQALVACTGTADAFCRACTEVPPPYPFVYGGNCSVVPIAPCPAGYFGQTTCAPCPMFYGPNAYAAVPQAGVCQCFPSGRMADGQCTVQSPFAYGIGSETVLSANPWLAGMNCTFYECPFFGCFLQQAFPRRCEQCPQGMYARNGLWCEACQGLRSPTLAQDGCVCRAPTFTRADGACVCPAGFQTGGPNGCEPCPEGAYQAADVALGESFWVPQVRCDWCPPGFVSTPTRTACVPCPAGAYREAGMAACRFCPDRTAYARDASSGASCTRCAPACRYGEQWGPCPVDPALFVCAACGVALSPGQRYVASADNTQCWTECLPGFYETGSLCRPCTNAACPPGRIFSSCSRYADYDCDLPCVNETKPLANSVWTAGCAWGCAAGFVMRQRRMPEWVEYACERQGAGPWPGWW